MSGRRGSISDYPEHLNPFYEGNEKFRFWKFGKVKRSGSFGESLRNTLTFKSFRGKKKDKQETPSSPPELRRNVSRNESHYRQTLPTLSPIYSPARTSVQIPLPRSRFSERVAKSSLNSPGDEVPNGHVPSDNTHKQPNPFDEKERVAALKPKRIRRRKRRAPLPPNMTREEGDAAYLGVSSMHNLSKWSLTSVETDVSTYSESENLVSDIVNQEISEIMNNITKEMEKMTDETNDTSIDTKENSEEKPHADMPDLIASSTEGNKNGDLKNSIEDVSQNEVTENEPNENPVDENSNVVSKIKCDNNDNESESVTNCNKEDSSDKVECDNNANSISEDSNSQIVYNTMYDHVSSEPDINFSERKSIYITASNDQLDKSNSLTNVANNTDVSENSDINQNTCTTPPISPRCKTEINMILNTVPQDCIEEQNDNGIEKEKLTETTPAGSPIPKVRTHKLSKGDLLGNDATASA